MTLSDPTQIRTTEINDISYTAGQEHWNKNLANFSIDYKDTDVNSYIANWTKWHGVYRKIPEARSTIDTWVNWIVGKKLIMDEKTKKIVDRIEGNNKDTFRTILKNIKRCSKICGNGYAEPIRDKAGRLINLKPLNPGAIQIISNGKAMIKQYNQVKSYQDLTPLATWGPEEMFDVPNDRIADEIHGIPELEKTYDIVRWKHQSMGDLATVFHRYVQPVLDIYAKTTDETELESIRTTFEKSFKNFENRIIPSDTIEKIERVSIPQFATLDPLPWQKFLRSYWTETSNVPDIIRGKSDEVSLAAGKLNVFSFKEKIIMEQIEFSEMIKKQLGLDIKFEEPPNLDVEIDNNLKAERKNEIKGRTSSNSDEKEAINSTD